MALNKNGMDLAAIKRDQKAINKLPNKGLAKHVALKSRTEKSAQSRADDALKTQYVNKVLRGH